MKTDDRYFMRLAIEMAWKWQGLTYPNPAVGCAVVRKGRLLAVEAHHRAGESHAEVRALLAAYEKLEKRSAPVDPADAHAAHEFLLSLPVETFRETTLYVTLEPCLHNGRTPSCAWLLSRFPLRRVVISSTDPVHGHSGGAALLGEHGIEVEIGMCGDDGEKLLEPFIIWQKRAFVLFKIAQTLNGKIGGGYLSCRESLEHVHGLRAVADELIVGGGTVRSDRPRLDCRFTGESPPNVTIYSRKKDFDREIPLFGVPERKVEIRDELDVLFKRPSFLLVEGGDGMLRAMRDSVDWMLIYQTPKLSSHHLSYNIDQKLEFLHHGRMGRDLIIWSRCG